MIEELASRLDDEIESTRSSLQFWQEQEGLEAHGPLAILMLATVHNHEAHLSHLERTRQEMAEIVQTDTK